MASTYNLSNIRILLTEGFSIAELRDFCFDTPEFRPVRHELAELSGQAAIVRYLLEFAERRDLLAALLAWAKHENPSRYSKHQPYEIQTPASEVAVTPIQASSSPSLRVFLCHASHDKPTVRNLYHRLRADGFEPWLDEENLIGGQDWQLEIPKAVRASDIVIVCLSPGVITKAGYVQKEIKFALDIADEQPEGTIFLIPLKLDECDVPERLRRWQWVNFFDEKGYERLRRSLQIRKEAKIQVEAERITEKQNKIEIVDIATEQAKVEGRAKGVETESHINTETYEAEIEKNILIEQNGLPVTVLQNLTRGEHRNISIKKSEVITHKQKRILVVEDIDSLRQLIVKEFESEGFAVDSAANLQDALDLIEAKTFHVATIDLMLSLFSTPPVGLKQ